jgi:hypothetical protein
LDCISNQPYIVVAYSLFVMNISMEIENNLRSVERSELERKLYLPLSSAHAYLKNIFPRSEKYNILVRENVRFEAHCAS